MSRNVIPPAYSEMIMSSSPPMRRWPLGTNRGVNEPSRSRGTSRGTGPASVYTVLGELPLRAFGSTRPIGSPFSYPR
jgi:hypothetical protein